MHERYFKPENNLCEASHANKVTRHTITVPFQSTITLRCSANNISVMSKLLFERRNMMRGTRHKTNVLIYRNCFSKKKKALTQSVLPARKKKEADKVCSTQDLIVHVRSMQSNLWNAIKSNSSLTLLPVPDNEAEILHCQKARHCSYTTPCKHIGPMIGVQLACRNT